MYMYYLLGYKMMGAILEDALLDRDTNKRYHYRRVTSILNHIPKDKVKKVHHILIIFFLKARKHANIIFIVIHIYK